MEIGWVERWNYSDTRYMYECDSVNLSWKLWALPSGSTLNVALIPGVNDTIWKAEYFVSGNWYVMEEEDLGFYEADNTYNRAEIDTTYEDFPIVPEIYTSLSSLYIDDDWVDWDDSIYTLPGAEEPYYVNYSDEYYHFTVWGGDRE